jgi:signal transduction histidine kinase
MNWIGDLVQWFAGGSRQYHDLAHCMRGDTLWIAITVILDLAVAAGYVVIAFHWGKNERMLPKSPAKTALGNMKNIFVFCGICGYIFIPVKMFWPAWRLYDITMAVLVYFTWRYAWNAKHLKVVYHELGRSRQLAEDLEKSREESRRKSFFLNALSHDLRTPLNGLLLQANYAELSLNKANEADVRDALAEIKACTRATSEMLDGLLEYAKVDWANDHNTVLDFTLDELLAQVTARLALMAEQKQIILRIGSARGLWLRTDRMKLDRIVSNLLSNAIKFTDAGEVRVEVQRSGNSLEIHVIDSGIGIDPSLRERLFDEFFQVHNHERDPRKGFGLGLAIARRLARQLGGEIQVDSTLGGGSRFTVVLPGIVTLGNDGRAKPSRDADAQSVGDGVAEHSGSLTR